MDSLHIILPAFVIGALLLCSHAVLGREVLRRGIIFLDLAIAQLAALGVVLAMALGLEGNTLLQQGIAYSAALFAAWVLSRLDQLAGRYQEAIIGVIFVVASNLVYLLAAYDSHGGEQVADLLLGQILWVQWSQAVMPALLAIVCIALAWLRPHWLGSRQFYLLFAVAITCSVQLLGVYLVFSSLILPALIAIFWQQRGLLWAVCFGLLAYAAGLLLSLHWDLPAGPLIVCCMAVVTLLLSFLRYGQRKAEAYHVSDANQ